MKTNSSININIDFESDAFTSEVASNLLISTIEYLLFQRHQIPFVFQTFKYMTSKWIVNDENTYETFHVEKQRRLALSTLNEVDQLCEHIRKECQQNSIITARIIFGATPLTPKEIYIIKLPKVCRQHVDGNHRRSADMTVNKVIMSLLSCEKLYHGFSRNLGVTNMYLDVETDNPGDTEHFQIKESSDISSRCPVIHINLIRMSSKSGDGNCCREIAVFQSIGDISLSQNIGKTDDVKNDEEMITDNLGIWKEAKVFIRGFKDAFVKGRSIWED